MADLFLASAGEKVKLWRTDGTNLTLTNQLSLYDGGSPAICWSNNNLLAGCSSTSDKIIIKNVPIETERDIVVSGKECLGMTCLTFEPSSNTVLAGDANGLVHVWDIRNQRLKKIYKSLENCVNSIQHNNDGSTLVAGYESGDVVFYKKTTNLTSHPLTVANKSGIRCLKFSHFQLNLLSAACDDGSVHLLDSTSQQVVHSYKTSHSAPSTCLAFSPINKMLMITVGLDKKIICYDMSSRKVVKSMACDGPLTSIDIHHNGSTFVVGTTRGKVCFYDLRQSRSSTPILVQAAHNSSVHSLLFQNKTVSKILPKSQLSVEKESMPSQEIHYKEVKETISKSNLSSDIFSPYRDEGMDVTESSLRHNMDRVVRDSLPSEVTRLSGIAALIFSPLANSSTGHSTSMELKSTPLHLGNIDEQIFSSLHCSPAAPGPQTPKLESGEERNRKKKQSSFITGKLCKGDQDPLELSDARSSFNEAPDKFSDRCAFEKISDTVNDNLIGAARTSYQPPVESFSADLIRRIVRDEIEEYFEPLHRSILNLHVEMLRKFQEQQTTMQRAVQIISSESELLEEIRQLREENDRLKKSL